MWVFTMNKHVSHKLLDTDLAHFINPNLCLIVLLITPITKLDSLVTLKTYRNSKINVISENDNERDFL